MGMGGAYISIAHDPTTALCNPACPIQMEASKFCIRRRHLSPKFCHLFGHPILYQYYYMILHIKYIYKNGVMTW